jgi:hypothetical protein
MATGDDLELGATNSASNTTHLAAQVSFAQGLLVTNGGGGATDAAVGVEGHASGSGPGVGVRGLSGGERSIGVEGGCTAGGTGVRGRSSTGTGVLGETTAGIGVNGLSTTSIGVRGRSIRGSGVFGTCDSNIGVSGDGNWGVVGDGVSIGVVGDGRSVGVWGHGSSANPNSVGVIGTGQAVGVWGISESGLAGRFDGNVLITGTLEVTGGIMSAAAAVPDGSRRRLYSLESPESWFEDFGTRKLVKGRAEVTIDRTFAAVVRGDFHIFLTPYGDSNGLYVARRSRRGFLVREQGGGTKSLVFSYRVVARRKDIAGTRFEKVDRRPARAALPRRPKKVRRAKKDRG